MKKRTKIILCVLAVCMLLGAAALGIVYKLYKDQNAAIMAIKDKVKIFLCDIRIDKLKDENAGITPGETVFSDEGKKILATDKGRRLIHYASGYYADFLEDAVFDLSASPDYVKVETENYQVTVSREYSTDSDVRSYVQWYLDRFLLDSGYREANGITMLAGPETGDKYDSFSVRLDNFDGGYDGYTYINVYTGTKIYYRLTFKFPSENFDLVSDEISALADGFTYFRPDGEDSYDMSISCLGPHGLSEEAASVYSQMAESKDIFWGLFTKDIYGEGIEKTIPEYEENLGYDFSIILSYIHFGDDFPADYARSLWEDGKIMELTYQLTTSNNENLLDYTPQLDVYRGLYDDEIRSLARAVADFGHPLLFRLGNEMNSDWTSYSGVVNMCDPELYISVWQKIYTIFQEEGATNAIWIYNPNDRAFPPCNWNSFLAYYPGNEYVHMIGITGYNNGTYYKKQNNEVWRSFKDIYDPIEEEYLPFFSQFPWIITEFASSSIGGDKAAWIEDMFSDISEYENIKAAVWFDYADFDPAYENVISRPYWLCETEEVTQAVKDGLAGLPKMKWDVTES